MVLKGKLAEKKILKGKMTSCEMIYMDAYELAVIHGFEGTIEEWLASIKGEKGETGEKGEKGDTGEKGDPGVTPTDAILYSTQTLTDEQMEQARKNIDAVSGERFSTVETDVSNLKSDTNDLYDKVSGLESTVETRLSKTLIWENAAKHSSFYTQTVAVDDIAQYDEIEVQFIDFSRQTGFTYGKVESAVNHGAVVITLYSDYASMMYRTFNITTNNGVQFSGCYKGTTQVASALIPYRIYGIKGVIYE